MCDFRGCARKRRLGVPRAETIGTNDQLKTAPDYGPIVVRTANGTIVRLADIVQVKSGVRNTLSAGWFNRQPAVVLIISKQVSANVIDTVDRIYATLGDLKNWVPADLKVSTLSDRTVTIRTSVHDMQMTLGVTVPLSLAGTCAAMWAAGFSIDNLSLMALAVSVGFVVDDAIVMIENVFRNIEAGKPPLQATIDGAKQIGFTVVAISLSLIAAFIPLLFMGGIVGRAFREFTVMLAFAIAVSTVVSPTVTPMICAHFVRAAPSTDETWLDRAVEAVMSRLLRGYRLSLWRRTAPSQPRPFGHAGNDCAHGAAIRQKSRKAISRRKTPTWCSVLPRPPPTFHSSRCRSCSSRRLRY